MSFFDSMLERIGLVRMSVHASRVKALNVFILDLGISAKNAGVNVLIDEGMVYDKIIGRDVYVIGDRVSVSDLNLIKSRLIHSPSSRSVMPSSEDVKS